MAGFSGPADALDDFGKSVKDLVLPLGDFHRSLASIGSGMAGFVAAFSPSQVQVFDQAMRDLSATIGRGMAPAFAVLTDVVKQAGAVLNPVFAEMGRIIAPLMETLGGVAVGVVKSLASEFAALAPLIETAVNFLSPLVEGLGAMARAVAIVGTALMSMATSGLDPKSNGIVSFGEMLRDLMQKLAGGIILMSAAIGKWLGSSDFLDGILKAGKGPEEKAITGEAAAQSSRFTSFSEFGRQMALSASLASGGASNQAKKTDDWLQDVLKEVQAIKDGASVEAILERWGGKFAVQLAAAIANTAKGAAAYTKAVNDEDKYLRSKGGLGVFALDDLIFGRPDF